MRISIILGLIALIVGIVLFFLTFVVFEDGGHLMEGKEEEVKKAVFDFIDESGLL